MKKVAILNIEQFLKQHNVEEFYANTLEDHLITSHKDIALPHSHNFYLAILFTHGSGIHEVDFTVYSVVPGSLFFLNPGQTHHWELSKDIKGYVFFHTQDFYDMQYTQATINRFPFFYSMHNLPVIYLKENELSIIQDLFKQVYEENNTNLFLKRQRILSLINLIYVESTRIYLTLNPVDTKNKNTYYIKFRQLEQFIEKHYKTKKSPSVYATMLNVSSKHLNRITQEVAGKTVTDVILGRVLLEAKKELVLQQHNFNEIAYALGYEDYAYFSRLFKKKTGETPSSFLKGYGKG
ncbi:helix-turn-helix domain-containing protein [Flavobacterium arcticum]|uniref:Helix-turn-helix domain-containing protein n=1 Tax=Flavobacterium arcticum TaxID=1784713 RepID=A0A345HD66_9FLAO|nr:helix-turn-helix domain-containing protein [Flavobacterium arcticum]AXG74526.1 helix-turn-helix domain-containing protein [Flavobacterium arcticum]KAF2512353.1 helix-turn-helix domain-containing protein [Flavobacterium arcticum]